MRYTFTEYINALKNYHEDDDGLFLDGADQDEFVDIFKNNQSRNES